MLLLGTRPLSESTTKRDLARDANTPHARECASARLGERLRLFLQMIGGLYVPQEPWRSLQLSDDPYQAGRLFRTWR